MKLKKMLKKTYKIETPPERAMPWLEYERRISKKWIKLLNSDGCDEKEYQSFFEEYPCFLPYVFGAFQVGHHGLFPNAVISQPILTGLSSRLPDFLMLAILSLMFA